MSVAVEEGIGAQGLRPAHQLVGRRVEQVQAAGTPAHQKVLSQDGQTGEMEGEGGHHLGGGACLLPEQIKISTTHSITV